MDAAVTVAGLIAIGLGVGHATIGLVWLLPAATRDPLPGTRIGPPSATESMIRVTWHIVTIFALASGGVLLVLAWLPDADPRTVLLRGFAVMWITATVMAIYVIRPRWRTIVRLPVPMLWTVVAVLCWQAST